MNDPTPRTPAGDAGYTAEGRELERDSLAPTYPIEGAENAAGADEVIVTETVTVADEGPDTIDGVEMAAAGDTSEMLGEVLQSQELNPDEPAVTNEPVPLEGTAPAVPAAAPALDADSGHVVEGRAMERENLAQSYPDQPVAIPVVPRVVADHQAAYQATYGAPSAPQQPTPAPHQPEPGNAGAYNPQAAVQAAALKKQPASLDPERVFLIGGIVVGCIVIVFGLCMLAFYTPAEVSEFFDGYRMNGSQAFSGTGATAQQILKAGFSMLLIAIGATDVCAFGAKLARSRKHAHRTQK